MAVKKIIKKIVMAVNRRLQTFRTGPESYITCCGNADGAGAQAHAVISTIIYARLFGLRYIHTPFQCIEHRPSFCVDWEEGWERFFNLGGTEMKIDANDLNFLEKRALKHPLLLWKKNKVLYCVRNCHEVTDVLSCGYAGLQQTIKRRFFAIEKNRAYQAQSKCLQVAVHVRRGDVSRIRNVERFTPFAKLFGVLDMIDRFCKQNNLAFQVNLFSQGQRYEFTGFEKYPVVFHLNENEFDTFLGLVQADVLLMAKSSFSYMAAYLSDGFVFYDEFWHPPLKTWTSMDAGFLIKQKRMQTFLAKTSIGLTQEGTEVVHKTIA